MNQQLIDDMADLKDEEVLAAVKASLEQGVPATEILADLQEGINIVGERFAANQYFLPQLMISGKLFKDAQAVLGDALGAREYEYDGIFLLGTVQKDVHDIGKNIVAGVMESNGFKVVDIGVDVPPARFVQAIKETDAKVIGLSCLLTTAFPSLKETVEAIDAAGLHEGRLLLIGGGPVDERTLEYCGADACCRTAQDGVEQARQFITQQG
jgi:methylmalonyl-CoA mutase cobalamin-binding domain/chain